MPTEFDTVHEGVPLYIVVFVYLKVESAINICTIKIKYL